MHLTDTEIEELYSSPLFMLWCATQFYWCIQNQNTDYIVDQLDQHYWEQLDLLEGKDYGEIKI